MKLVDIHAAQERFDKLQERIRNVIELRRQLEKTNLYLMEDIESQIYRILRDKIKELRKEQYDIEVSDAGFSDRFDSVNMESLK